MIDFSADIESCLKVLSEGGIILYPTDTIWGLGCDATNPEAVEKLIDLKGKPPGKGMIVLLANERDVLRYTATPDLEIFNYLSTTTKPTTVIYQNGIGLADQVLNEDGSIAIRLVKEAFCSHLINRYKKPIVSTSANFHGKPSPQNFTEISFEIKSSVDYVVNFRQNENLAGSASAIVLWKNGELTVIRG